MNLYESCLEQREELAYFMRRLYTQKLTTTSGGNLSMKIDDKHIIITPSSLDKARIQAEQIGLMTLDGENLTPHLKPSIESGMHRAIYKARGDISAIVHAHPVTASTFAAMDMNIDITLTAEAFYVLKQVDYSPYALMGTDGLADIVAKSLEKCNISVMKNHGISTVGNTILQAFDRLEVLEGAAIMTMNTALLKLASPMTSENIDELKAKFS